MKLKNIFKVSIKASIVEGVAGLAVLVPFLLLAFISFDNLEETNLFTMGYLAFLVAVVFAKGFVLIKYRNWIYK